MVVCQFTSKSK